MEQLLVFIALHGGVHHTAVDKDDGSPEGVGPRLEAEVEAQPERWISGALVAGFWRYSDTGLHDGVTDSSYDIRSTSIAGGLRLRLRPHPRVFLGGTVWVNNETHTSSGSELSGSHDHTITFFEVSAGGTVATVGAYDLQVTAALAMYGRYGGLEYVETGSLMIGIRRAVSGARSR